MQDLRWDWPKQTLFGFGDEEVGWKAGDPLKLGDCWRCCIAAVLQLPAGKVPHFVQLSYDRNRSCDAITQVWLAERGYWLIKGGHGELYEAFGLSMYSEDRSKVPYLPVLSCGPTVRSKHDRQTHCVVINSHTGKVLYDPHPSEAGLLAVTSRYIIVPHLTKN